MLLTLLACGTSQAPPRQLPPLCPDCAEDGAVDADGDGFDAGVDCDDAAGTIYPDAPEIPYDGVDQDCDGADLVDVDGDGVPGPLAGGDDCDDTEPLRWPGADDQVGDAFDQNCDGVDGVDLDGDSWPGTGSGGDDCDDLDATRNPGAEEIYYDAVDQDCDRACDWDQDGDGAVGNDHAPVDNGPCDADPTPGVVLAPPDCDDTDATASTNTLQASDPPNGGSRVDPRAAVLAHLLEPEVTALLSIADAAGVAYSGTTVWLGTSLAWLPDAPLPASLDLQATLDWSCGPEQWLFTTDADPQAAAVDPASLVSRTWVVDPAGGTWLEPAGLGAVLPPIWLSATVETSDGVTLLVGVAAPDGAAQDLCVPTSEVDGDLTMTPFVRALAQDLLVEGTLAVDGSAIGELTLRGVLDARDLPGVCSQLACAPCDDGQPSCLSVHAVGLSATEAAEMLIERTPADIASDPEC